MAKSLYQTWFRTNRIFFVSICMFSIDRVVLCLWEWNLWADYFFNAMHIKHLTWLKLNEISCHESWAGFCIIHPLHWAFEMSYFGACIARRYPKCKSMSPGVITAGVGQHILHLNSRQNIAVFRCVLVFIWSKATLQRES